MVAVLAVTASLLFGRQEKKASQKHAENTALASEKTPKDSELSEEDESTNRADVIPEETENESSGKGTAQSAADKESAGDNTTDFGDIFGADSSEEVPPGNDELLDTSDNPSSMEPERPEDVGWSGYY